jgi:uncharacterized protein
MHSHLFARRSQHLRTHHEEPEKKNAFVAAEIIKNACEYDRRMILQAILSVVLALLIGEIIKVALQRMHHEHVQPFHLGGMPSTHTASVTALLISVFIETRLSLLFLCCVVFGVIVIRDAYTLRWEVTKHSMALNKLLQQKTFIRVGHKELEVFAGATLGVVVTAAVYLLI